MAKVKKVKETKIDIDLNIAERSLQKAAAELRFNYGKFKARTKLKDSVKTDMVKSIRKVHKAVNELSAELKG